jgi:hypothetical protein
MKKVSLKMTALVLLLGGAKGVVHAQNSANTINVVTTAIPFLRISPDARGGAMGDVGIATAPDANSPYWNQGKTAFNPNKGSISFTYTPWLKDLGLNDIYLANASGYYKLSDEEAISGSLRYFSLGNIEFTDNSGNAFGSFRPREFAVDAGYSRKLSAKLGLGISLRFVSSNLSGGLQTQGASTKPGRSVSGDIHLYHNNLNEKGAGLSWGVTLSNLGSKISYSNDAINKDYIPANLGLGIAYTTVLDETSKLTFAADLNKLMVPTPPNSTDSAEIAKYRSQGVVSSWFKSFGDAPGGFSEEIKEVQASVGAEYWYNNQFAFRAGYFYESPLKGNRQYFTLGAGLKYNNFGLNFSYLLPSGNGTTRNPLSNTLRFSLFFDFDGGGGGSEEKK